jgi:hypothetical protein
MCQKNTAWQDSLGLLAAMIRSVMADQKLYDDTHKIPDQRGNGLLRREVWVDAKGRVTRYNLAYLNPALHSGDNGRVIGYDNAHDGHHRHFFGRVEPVAFVSFEDTEARFEQDWTALRKTS